MEEKLAVLLTGVVPQSSLGRALVGEHVLRDLRPRATSASSDAALSLETLRSVRSEPFSFTTNLLLDSKSAFLREVPSLQKRGVRTIVATCDVADKEMMAGLREIAETGGVSIIGSVAIPPPSFLPANLRKDSPQITALELLPYFQKPEAGGRAGVLGPVETDFEGAEEFAMLSTVLRACLVVQRSCGCPLLIETPKADAKRRQIMDVITAEGEQKGIVVFTSAERLSRRFPAIEEIINAGIGVCFSILPCEGSLESSQEIVLGSDKLAPTYETVVNCIVALQERELLSSVFLASGVQFKHHQRQYGGNGYAAAVENFSRIAASIVGEDKWSTLEEMLLEKNTAHLLCWYEPPKKEEKAIPKWQCDQCGKRVSFKKEPFKKFEFNFCSMKCLKAFVEEKKPKSQAPSSEGFHRRGGMGASNMGAWDLKV